MNIPMITFDTGRLDKEGKSIIIRRPFMVTNIRYDEETLKQIEMYANKRLQYNQNCTRCFRGVLAHDFRGAPILCDCVKPIDLIVEGK